MAGSDLLVTISGAALSLLFYENVRSFGDQMGFLLGETLEFVVKTYTDSDNQLETVKIHVNVETVVSCPSADVLHDSTGRINKEKLKDLIREKSKQVIGWFRFRRNACLLPTLRDKLLHKQFASHFSGDNGSKEEFFVACLLSSSTSNAKGTHKFRHVFLRHKRGAFEPISLRINNLGDDASRHDGSDYKPIPNKKLLVEPDVFSKLVESLNLNLTRTPAVESAITIQKAAEQYLSSLIPKLCESDREVADLEKQVRELKAKIAVRTLSKKAKVLNESSEGVHENYEVGKSSKTEDALILEKGNRSPPRIDSPDRMDNHDGQTFTGHKTRNTVAYIEKSVSEENARRMSTGVEAQNCSTRLEDPFANVISEMRVDVAESGGGTSNKSRRGIMGEMAKESICKGGVQEFTSSMKKVRRTSGPVIPRCAGTEKARQNSQVSDQNSIEANNAHSSRISYGQATRKSIEGARGMSVSPENH